MRVVTVPVLEDNYAYLLIDEATESAAIIDPSEADPPLRALAREGAKLEAILNTHHHHDHTGGNREIVERHPGLRVVGYARDRERIPALTEGVAEGDPVRVG